MAIHGKYTPEERRIVQQIHDLKNRMRRQHENYQRMESKMFALCELVPKYRNNPIGGQRK